MKLSLLFIFLVVSALTFAEGDFALGWRPKEGDSASYRMTFSATLAGGPLLFETDLTRRVAKVEKAGNFVVQSSFRNGKSTIEGVQQPIQDQTSMEKYDARGRTIAGSADQPDDQFTIMLSFLTDRLDPGHSVKVGDKWTASAEADATEKNPASSADFEAVGVEKLGAFEALKVKVAFIERQGDKPTSFNGYVWVSTSDASLVSIDATIDNLRLDPTLIANGAKLKLTRT